MRFKSKFLSFLAFLVKLVSLGIIENNLSSFYINESVSKKGVLQKYLSFFEIFYWENCSRLAFDLISDGKKLLIHIHREEKGWSVP